MDPSIAPPDGRAVADAYRLGRPVTEPVLAARGELGRIWRFETTAGTWAVKTLIQPQSEANARRDVDFQLAALAAGIPMPRPVQRPDGQVLAHAPAGEATVGVRVYEWVDLSTPAANPAPFDAGAILGRMHQVRVRDDRAPDPWYTDPVGSDRWHELVDLVRRGNPRWAPAFAAIVPDLVDAEAVLPADLTREWTCHLDFNTDNVLLDVRGRPVVVDWENAGPAAFDEELAMALVDWDLEPGSAGAFLRGYRSAGGPARLSGAVSFAMAVAVQAHLLDAYASGHLDPTVSDEDRARYGRRVDEALRRPITRASIDAMLAAVDDPSGD